MTLTHKTSSSWLPKLQGKSIEEASTLLGVTSQVYTETDLKPFAHPNNHGYLTAFREDSLHVWIKDGEYIFYHNGKYYSSKHPESYPPSLRYIERSLDSSDGKGTARTLPFRQYLQNR